MCRVHLVLMLLPAAATRWDLGATLLGQLGISFDTTPRCAAATCACPLAARVSVVSGGLLNEFL